MQEEFIRQYKYIEDLLQRCYPGAQISLDFAMTDILEYFSDIAMNHWWSDLVNLICDNITLNCSHSNLDYFYIAETIVLYLCWKVQVQVKVSENVDHSVKESAVLSVWYAKISMGDVDGNNLSSGISLSAESDCFYFIFPGVHGASMPRLCQLWGTWTDWWYPGECSEDEESLRSGRHGLQLQVAQC